jgi:hypothetical protein
VVKALREEKLYQRNDERILGDGDFVGRVLALANEAMERRCALKARGVDLSVIAARVSAVLGVKPEEVWAEGKYRRIVTARSLNTVMILKAQLKHIWSYKSRTWAGKALDHWCALARWLNHRSLNKFAMMLERHRYGILNHCDYPIHTGKLEGVNNKIKVIKRKAYGFHDLRYFTLKIFQACYN